MTLIFTEALRTTGLGHLGRCTALSEAILESGKTVEIIVDSDGTGLDLFKAFPLHPFDWKRHGNLENILADRLPAAAIVDSYLAEAYLYKILSDKVLNLICIDDTNRIAYPVGATILNPGFPGQYINYDTARHMVLTGPEYVLLRSPFCDPTNLLSLKERPENIVITLGGEDRLNLMPAILSYLCKQYPDLKKNLVIGPGFQNVQEIINARDNNTTLLENLTAPQIFQLMLNADMAISAGGQTAYEFARCGVPMVLIETAENQRKNIRGFVERNMALSAEMGNESLRIAKLHPEVQRLMEMSVRLDLRNACQRYVDGNGARRISDRLALNSTVDHPVRNQSGEYQNVRSIL